MWPSRNSGSLKSGIVGVGMACSGPGPQPHLHLAERAQVVDVRTAGVVEFIVLGREVGAAATAEERGGLALGEGCVLVAPRRGADVDHVAEAIAGVLVL